MTDIVITHLEVVECGDEGIHALIHRRLEPTGVFNVASGVVVREDDYALDLVVYRVSFDPWYWTGRQV